MRGRGGGRRRRRRAGRVGRGGDARSEPLDGGGRVANARWRFFNRRGGEAAAKAQKAARRLKILEEILLSERKDAMLLSLMKVYLVPLRTVWPRGKGQIFTPPT